MVVFHLPQVLRVVRVVVVLVLELQLARAVLAIPHQQAPHRATTVVPVLLSADRRRAAAVVVQIKQVLMRQAHPKRQAMEATAQAQILQGHPQFTAAAVVAVVISLQPHRTAQVELAAAAVVDITTPKRVPTAQLTRAAAAVVVEVELGTAAQVAQASSLSDSQAAITSPSGRA